MQRCDYQNTCHKAYDTALRIMTENLINQNKVTGYNEIFYHINYHIM